MKKLVLIIALPICMVACSKTKQYYITNQQLRDAMNIREGSYFIYRDSATGVLDTVTIDSYGNSFAEPKDYGGNKYEYIGVMGGHSLKKGYAYSFILGAYPGSMNIIRARLLANTQEVHIAVLPFSESGIYDGGTQTSKYIKYYSVFSINSSNYEDVFEIISEPHYCHSFFSLNSGLVKYTIKSEDDTGYTTYELIDSKIIR